ncbi:hypothetical protein Hanom_Chr14g01248171 [Helianthus anomalus]
MFCMEIFHCYISGLLGLSVVGGILKLVGGSDYLSKRALVDYRVKSFSYVCIGVFKDELLSTSLDSGSSINIMLKATAMLIDSKLPWSCKIVSYLLQQNVYRIFQEVVITGKVDPDDVEDVCSNYGHVNT